MLNTFLQCRHKLTNAEHWQSAHCCCNQQCSIAENLTLMPVCTVSQLASCCNDANWWAAAYQSNNGITGGPNQIVVQGIVYFQIIAQCEDVYILRLQVFKLKLQTQNACCLIGIFVAVKKDFRISVVVSCKVVDGYQCGAAIQRTHEGQQAFVALYCQLLLHYWAEACWVAK